MQLITWNVQWCRGVDLAVNAARIVAEAKKLADFDVLCLQEIADNYPDPRLGGNDGKELLGSGNQRAAGQRAQRDPHPIVAQWQGAKGWL